MTVLTIERTQFTLSGPSCQDSRVLSDSQSRTESGTCYAVHPATRELVEIDPEQRWFWTPEWQAGERMVEEDLRLGRYEDFDSMDDFLQSL